MKHRTIPFVIAVSCLGAVSTQAQTSFPNGISVGNPADAYFTSDAAGSGRMTGIGSETGGLLLWADLAETAPGAWDGGITLIANPLTFVPAAAPGWLAGGTFDIWSSDYYSPLGAIPVFRIDTAAGTGTFDSLDVSINNGTLSIAGSPALTTSSAPSALTGQGFLQLSGGVLNIPSTMPSSSSTTGALTVAGGVGIEKDSWFNGVRIGRGGSDTVTNTAIGSNVLASSTGESNTAVGATALMRNTSGFQNSSFGSNSLQFNTTGSGNSAFGSDSMYGNTGSNNTTLGSRSLFGKESGSNNLALGYAAGELQLDGSSLTTASNSIYIGVNSRGKDNADSNSIVIGFDSVGQGVNTTVIGNSETLNTFLYGETNVDRLRISGQVVIEQSQGDISMGIYGE